jgi:hypothetical protein
MESSLMAGSDVATLAAAPKGQDVRKRWLLLALALVVGLVAAFAIGSAIKKTSAPTPTGSLAQASSASGQHASITALATAGAVPALHAPPPKAKPKTTPTHTSPASSAGTSGSGTAVSAGSTQSSSPVQSAPSTQSSAPTQSATPTHTGSGSTSSGTTGVSHSGGGGGGGGAG